MAYCLLFPPWESLEDSHSITVLLYRTDHQTKDNYRKYNSFNTLSVLNVSPSVAMASQEVVDYSDEEMPAATSVPQAFPEVLLDCSNGNYAGESKLPRVFQYCCHLTEHGSLDKALSRHTDDDGARTAAVKEAQTKRSVWLSTE